MDDSFEARPYPLKIGDRLIMCLAGINTADGKDHTAEVVVTHCSPYSGYNINCAIYTVTEVKHGSLTSAGWAGAQHGTLQLLDHKQVGYVGLGWKYADSQPKQNGAICKKCNQLNEYAEPNNAYVCYACRP